MINMVAINFDDYEHVNFNEGLKNKNKNKFIVVNEFVIVKLNRGLYALLDNNDRVFELLSNYVWYANKDRRTYYLRTNVKNDDKKIIQFHRIYTECPTEMVIDHLNHNGLDNRAFNLKVCNQKDNLRFDRRQRRNDSTTGYKNISFDKRYKSYRVIITFDGKRYTKSFAIKKYGLLPALKNAIDYRDDKINEFLNIINN